MKNIDWEKNKEKEKFYACRDKGSGFKKDHSGRDFKSILKELESYRNSF